MFIDGDSVAMPGLLPAFPQSACLARAHSAGLCFLDELPFEFVTPCEEGENLLGSHIVSTFLATVLILLLYLRQKSGFLS